jgi:hypothetical protein
MPAANHAHAAIFGAARDFSVLVDVRT